MLEDIFQTHEILIVDFFLLYAKKVVLFLFFIDCCILPFWSLSAWETSDQGKSIEQNEFFSFAP